MFDLQLKPLRFSGGGVSGEEVGEILAGMSNVELAELIIDLGLGKNPQWGDIAADLLAPSLIASDHAYRAQQALFVFFRTIRFVYSSLLRESQNTQ